MKMTSDAQVAIIGAGIAGLACAMKLQDAGVDVLVFDKGRGMGGRTATRRTRSGIQFDHGAQYFSARHPDFRDVVEQAKRAGMVSTWALEDGPRNVGVPGMTGLAKFLGQKLEIHQDVKVDAICCDGGGCDITLGGKVLPFPRVVSTVPAPQAIALLGEQHPFVDELANVEILPCLTLMAAFKTAPRISMTAHRDPSAPISWIASDSSKPGRPAQNCWVAHASAEWSAHHLEEPKEDIAQRMLPMLCNVLGYRPSDVVHAEAHRWRYAAVSKPLGRPYMRNATGSLYLGGDWCLDARVEAAWISGTAIALDILENP